MLIQKGFFFLKKYYIFKKIIENRVELLFYPTKTFSILEQIDIFNENSKNILEGNVDFLKVIKMIVFIGNEQYFPSNDKLHSQNKRSNFK